MKNIPPSLVGLSAAQSAVADLKRMAEEMVGKGIFASLVVTPS